LRAIERTVGRRIDRRRVEGFDLTVPQGHQTSNPVNPSGRSRRANGTGRPSAPPRRRHRGAKVKQPRTGRNRSERAA
jgi:hypothetical protein